MLIALIIFKTKHFFQERELIIIFDELGILTCPGELLSFQETLSSLDKEGE